MEIPVLRVFIQPAPSSGIVEISRYGDIFSTCRFCWDLQIRRQKVNKPPPPNTVNPGSNQNQNNKQHAPIIKTVIIILIRRRITIITITIRLTTVIIIRIIAIRTRSGL